MSVDRPRGCPHWTGPRMCWRCREATDHADKKRQRETKPWQNAMWNRKHRTGWTQEMVDAAMRRQRGRCATCRKPMVLTGKTFASIRCVRGATDITCFGCHMDVVRAKRTPEAAKKACVTRWAGKTRKQVDDHMAAMRAAKERAAT